MENYWIEKWLSLQVNPRTKASYRLGMEKFVNFCKEKRINGLETIVQDYRVARDDDDRRKLQQFIDSWDDVLQEYTISLANHEKHAPAAVKTYLATVQSFFRTCKVPVEVGIPKRVYTMYPKADLKRENIQLIITRSNVRNRAIWLMLLESGIRPYTVTQIRWDWIKEDYLEGKVPMLIRIPQRYTKDVVGDRWSFIGSDGYDALREYLEPRLPLHDDDYVFVRKPPKPKKKRLKRYVPGTPIEHREDPLRLPGIPFTSSNLSATFSNTVKTVGLDSGIFGKPGKVRLYCLKNWFRNHCKADYGYIMFWMCRSTQTDSHYVSRDIEEHRERYREVYPGLRVMEETTAIKNVQKEIQKQFKQKDQEIQELRKEVSDLKGYSLLFQKIAKHIEKREIIVWNPAKMLKVFADSIEKSEYPYHDEEDK